MPTEYSDVIGFGEIGGVGEMIYHTVRFRKYDLETDGGVQILRPRCRPGSEPEKNTDFSLTGQQLLASLCNLFRRINGPACEEPYIELIANWCRENTHPYGIDGLFDMLSDRDFDLAREGFLAELDGAFEINEFIRDLANVYHTFMFYFALDRLRSGNDRYARELYYEGRFYDGYPFFERYKSALPREADGGKEDGNKPGEGEWDGGKADDSEGNGDAEGGDESDGSGTDGNKEDWTEEGSGEEGGGEADSGEEDGDEEDGDESMPASDEASRMRPFVRSPAHDYEALQNTLLSLFPEFRMKLKTHPRTKRVVYAADVQSVFDICWYTLSRLAADDAPPLGVNSFELYSEGSILSCLCCGDFFMRRSSTQKYCSNPNCQAERNRRKSKACRGRKGVEKKG